MQMAGKKSESSWVCNHGSQGLREGCVQKSVPETELCKWRAVCVLSVLAYMIKMPSNSKKIGFKKCNMTKCNVPNTQI